MVAFVTATINASSEPRDDLALNAIALRISSVTALLLNVPLAVSGASAAIAAPTAMTADHASSDSFMISPGSAARRRTSHAPCDYRRTFPPAAACRCKCAVHLAVHTSSARLLYHF